MRDLGLLERADELAPHAGEVELGADHHHAGGLAEVEPEGRRAGGQRQRVARRDRLERLLEQRRLDGELLVAHHVAQPRHRGQQRGGGLGGGLGELAYEAAPRAGEHEPASADGRGHGVPAAHVELDEAGRLLAHRAEQLVDRRLAGHDVGPALGADQHHAGVEEARQPVDHRALGLWRAQRVDEVALQRRQPAEDLLLAAGQRAVDEVDDLAERRLVRDGEDREGVHARDLDERRRHALERQAGAEAERARAAVLKLGHQAALRAGVAAQPDAGGEHHPLRPEPALRLRDLDGVRAEDLRFGVAAEQLEPEGLLGQQIGETEHGFVAYGGWTRRYWPPSRPSSPPRSRSCASSWRSRRCSAARRRGRPSCGAPSSGSGSSRSTCRSTRPRWSAIRAARRSAGSWTARRTCSPTGAAGPAAR